MTDLPLMTLTPHFGSPEQQRSYASAKARLDSLPVPYDRAARAVASYLVRSGTVTDGAVAAVMIADLAEVWACAAADGTPVSEFVGSDPVGFAETFAGAYGRGFTVEAERARLVAAIVEAAHEAER